MGHFGEFHGNFSPRRILAADRPGESIWAIRLRMSKPLLLLAILSLATGVLADEAVQPLETITASIRQYIESNFRQPSEGYEIQVPPMDSRLRLALCTSPLEVFTPPGARETGHVSVGVRCPGSQPWTIYHRAYVAIFQEVAVLVGAAKAGTVLTANDIRVEKRDVSTLNGQFLSPERAVGRPLKKALPANTVLLPDFLTTIKAVKRGELVTIRNRSSGFEISMPGIAMSDGEVGQRIRVRNEQSGRVIQATVTASGVVDVNP